MPKNAWCPTPHAKTIRKDKGNHLPERNAFIVTSVGRCHDEIVSSSRIELDVYIRQSKVRRGEFVITSTIFIIRIVVVMPQCDEVNRADIKQNFDTTYIADMYQ